MLAVELCSRVFWCIFISEGQFIWATFFWRRFFYWVRYSSTTRGISESSLFPKTQSHLLMENPCEKIPARCCFEPQSFEKRFLWSGRFTIWACWPRLFKNLSCIKRSFVNKFTCNKDGQSLRLMHCPCKPSGVVHEMSLVNMSLVETSPFKSPTLEEEIEPPKLSVPIVNTIKLEKWI